MRRSESRGLVHLLNVTEPLYLRLRDFENVQKG